jgi:hypothetical protein
MVSMKNTHIRTFSNTKLMALPRMLSRPYGETICQRRFSQQLHVLASLLPDRLCPIHAADPSIWHLCMKNKNLAAVVRLMMLIGQKITFLAVPIISVG